MRVFISSTPDELELYQAAACDVAHGLGMEPVVRDPAAGRGRKQVAACAQQVASADLLLVIVGWRRGRVPAPELGGDGLHPWTFWEVRSAFEHRKPVRVLMAGENWRPELREETSRGWAVMQDLRAELAQLALTFDDEGGLSEDSGVGEFFTAQLRRQLSAAQQGLPAPDVSTAVMAREPAGLSRGVERQARPELRAWPTPDWPKRPYPLLLPYTHPDLMAGREQELVELRQRLRRRVPILGLHATSGTGKSSLLSAALVPVLRAEGYPVAFDRSPHQPGLAQRLLEDLLEIHDAPGWLEAIASPDPRGFIERLAEVIVLAGDVPILILDQFEELFRDDRQEARARVGLLLAASVQHPSGFQDLPCRWLLAYRREFHGQVSSWLRDVLREARQLDLPGASQLPHDLSVLERFCDWPLPVFGGERRDSRGDSSAAPPETRLQAAQRAFTSAIEKPLATTTPDGDRRYRWCFAEGGIERLARAFAEARVARPDAPLVPELQVVLGHLFEQARAVTPADAEFPVCIEVPEDPGGLIEQALEQHLKRALDAADAASERAEGKASHRSGRTRALLALHELAEVEGHRLAGRPAVELAQAIGASGHEVLESMATPETRLVILEQQDGAFCYSLSHDRMAEVILRAVAEEGRSFDLAIDRELLALRRFVVLRSELYRSGEIEQATAVPRRHFRQIQDHSEILLWGEERQRWWAACQKRWQLQRRWAAFRYALVLVAIGLVGLGAWRWVDVKARRQALLDQVAEGEPEAAFATLYQLAESAVEDEELLASWRRREQPLDVFELGLGGVDGARRGDAVLRLTELAGGLQESPEDPTFVAPLVWALDFFAPRDGRAQALRDRVLKPLRQRRPPPTEGDSDIVTIAAGRFQVGASPAELAGLNSSPRPAEEVAIEGFRILTHEVTQAQYRRLAPDHDPDRADGLPVVRVNWYEAYTYAAWLGGRLPTVAEAEYSAHAGCSFVFCRRDGSEAEISQVAWWLGTSVDSATQEPTAHPVMQLEPNPWGLFDAYGNVWEWTADWIASNTQPLGASGPTRGGAEIRERFGGSAWEPEEQFLTNPRGASEVMLQSSQIGLRVVFPQLPQSAAEPEDSQASGNTGRTP